MEFLEDPLYFCLWNQTVALCTHIVGCLYKSTRDAATTLTTTLSCSWGKAKSSAKKAMVGMRLRYSAYLSCCSFAAKGYDREDKVISLRQLTDVLLRRFDLWRANVSIANNKSFAVSSLCYYVTYDKQCDQAATELAAHWNFDHTLVRKRSKLTRRRRSLLALLQRHMTFLYKPYQQAFIVPDHFQLTRFRGRRPKSDGIKEVLQLFKSLFTQRFLLVPLHPDETLSTTHWAFSQSVRSLNPFSSSTRVSKASRHWTK